MPFHYEARVSAVLTFIIINKTLTKDCYKPGGIMPIGAGIPIIGPTGPPIGAIGPAGIIPGGPPSKLPCGLAPGGR